jgi:hypothetical protein
LESLRWRGKKKERKGKCLGMYTCLVGVTALLLAAVGSARVQAGIAPAQRNTSTRQREERAERQQTNEAHAGRAIAADGKEKEDEGSGGLRQRLTQQSSRQLPAEG